MNNDTSAIVNISVYGAGNFGYAILKHLDNKKADNLSIRAYDRNTELIKSLKEDRRHLRFHKNVKLSNKIKFMDNHKDLLEDCNVLVLAVSSDATREVLNNIKDHIKDGLIIINTAKALDNQTGKRLSEVVAEELHGKNYSYAVLAGGTIAKDLFKHEPLGVDIACQDKKTAILLKEVFQSDNLFTYATDDLAGVEYAGAYKNIIAILAGVMKGLGFSYGAETRIISRTAHDLGQTLINKYGASPETFSIGSQCWGNDMWMSCTGNTRNREFGILLGKGIPVDEAINTMSSANKTVEGINSLQVISKAPSVLAIEPINTLYKLVILKSISPAEAEYLLSRNNT